MKIKHNRTRKIKKKINKNKNNSSVNSDNDDNHEDNENIGNIKINDDVGCITVNNSFEDNFRNFFKNKRSKIIKKNNKYNTIGKELITAFGNPIAPKSVNLKDDFYTYVNYEWLHKMKNKKVKNYYTRIDSFRMLQEKVYYQLIDLVKAYISEHSTHKSTMIRNVYESFLHLDELSCERHWKTIQKELDDIFENKSCTDLLIYMNRN